MKDFKNMKYIASRIEATEKKNIENSWETDELTEKKMLEFARKLDAEYESRRKKKNLMKVFGRCAAAVICIAILGFFTIPSVDAWKSKINGWNAEEGDGNIRIEYGSSGKREDMKGHYMFSELPDGYRFDSADDNEFHKCLIFTDGNGSFLLITSFSSDSVVNLNKEGALCKEVTVRGHEGYLISREDENSKFVFWAEESSFIQIQSDGESLLTDDELLELAENIKFL